MKSSFKILAVAAAAFAACGAEAQLVTFQTVSTWSGSVNTLNASNTPTPPDNGSYLGQTFSNVLAIQSMTYNFFSASGTSSAGQVHATFGEWNAGTNTFSGQTTDFGLISIPSSASWTSTVTAGSNTYSTFTATLSFGSLYLTDPTKTYAVVFQNTSLSDTGFGLGLNNSNPFIYGGSIDGLGDPLSSRDFAFSQIVVVPNDGSHVVPVPEASTVAALMGGAFAVLLAGLRLRQRKQFATAAVVTA